MPISQTDRLIFETWTLDDFEEFAALARDPEVMRFIAEGTPWPDARIGWFLGIQSTLQDTLGYCNWKLLNRDGSTLLGFCGLAPLTSVGEVEIGWWLKPEWQGQGLAYEAASHVLERAFTVHDLPCVVARAYRTNEPSIRLMTRLGMGFERKLGDGPMGEIVLYGKMR